MFVEAAKASAIALSGIFTKSLQLGEKTVEVANTTADFANDTVGVARKTTVVVNAAQDNIVQRLNNVNDLTNSATKFSTDTIEQLTKQLKGVSATSQEGLKLLTAAAAVLNSALIDNKNEFASLIASPVKIASGLAGTIYTLVRIVLVVPFDSFGNTIDRIREKRQRHLNHLKTLTDKANEIALLEKEIKKLELLKQLNLAADAKQSNIDKILSDPQTKINKGTVNAVSANKTYVGEIIAKEQQSLEQIKDRREAVETLTLANATGEQVSAINSSSEVSSVAEDNSSLPGKTNELGDNPETPVAVDDSSLQVNKPTSPYSKGQSIEYKNEQAVWVSATYESLNEADGTINVMVGDKLTKNVDIDNTRSLSTVRTEPKPFKGGRRRKTKMRGSKHRQCKAKTTRKCHKTVFDIRW